MRGVLGSSCPWTGCDEAIREVGREGNYTVAYCYKGHDSIVSSDGRSLEAPSHSCAPDMTQPEVGRDWGMVIAFAALIVFVLVVAFTVGTELPY